MAISPKDRTILRDLATQIAEIAALPVHKEKEALWTKLNGLQRTRPMVKVCQMPWSEMNVDDELSLRTSEQSCRGMEQAMRQQLYQWRHVPDDQIVEETLWCRYAVRDTGFGIAEQSEVNTESGIRSRHFHEQIHTMDDVEKIKIPEVTHDEAATQRHYELLSGLFGDIRPVAIRGIDHHWFAPWDRLITWYGVDRAMMDMVLKPDLVNACIGRLVDGYLHMLARWEELNVLSLPSGNSGAGSGGLACTDELPPAGYDPDRITPKDLWGCATPQIFSEISPQMHWEFALRHEMRWLEKWGLNYYGCCEQLHHKIDLLRRIPNLRKISISPRADKVVAAESIGRDYVVSLKPNPAILATDDWNLDMARRELTEDLDKLRGCVVEIVLKDISTVRHEPQRLWQWAEMTMEVAEAFGAGDPR